MIKYIDELKKEELEGKKVLLRVDFDVPVIDGKIAEKFRVKSQKETIDYLLNNGAKVLLVSHIGHDDPKATFSPIVEQLGEILSCMLTLVPHSELVSAHEMFQVSPVLLLDNIRQDPREIENKEGLALSLSKGFDYYVNNAFAVCHRRHASVSAITKHLPSYAGLLVRKETETLLRAISEPAAGKVLVLGGAKIITKIPVIKNFLDKAERILIGGALANDFFQARGISIGDSLVDKNIAPDIISDKLILPQDTLVAPSLKNESQAKAEPIKDVPAGYYMPDIGPKTAKEYAEIIKSAKMAIWNGPMGKFEEEDFASGTRIVAEAVALAPYSLVGGGDTIAVVDKFGLLDKYSFISTGGGAMLEFLAGNRLPGLEALGYYE